MTGAAATPEEQRAHGVDELARGLVTVAGARGSQDGHKGLGKCAFGEQPPQEVGDTKSNLVGIGPG